jgi:hypothetical protein
VTAELREALRAEADTAPAYAVYERALKTARKRRRSRWGAIAAAAAVLVVLLVSGMPGVLLSRVADPPIAGTSTDPSLPDRLAFPPAFWPGIRSSPPGTASVVFGGQGFAVDSVDRLWDNEGDLAVVGATSEVYRVWRVSTAEFHAGEDVLLSPDGGRLAITSGLNPSGPAVIDLRTGKPTRLTAFNENDYVYPVAWSPDGTTLAVGVVDASGGGSSIGLVDVPDGAYRRLGEMDRNYSLRGFEAAFAPDGLRWAYQEGSAIAVVDRELNTQARWDVGAARLAGKGAWAPDGSVMTVLATGGHWLLKSWSRATGALTGRQWTVDGDFTAVRLIGWSAGQPVVVVFRREPTAPVQTEPDTSYQAVHSIEVWRLTAGGHDVLVRAPHNLMSIDIADTVIAGGRMRAAAPPRFGPLSVLLPVALVAGGALFIRRRVRDRRRAADRRRVRDRQDQG